MQNQGAARVKEHYKMYKKGKVWVFSLLFTSGAVICLSQTSLIHASAVVDSQNSTISKEVATADSTVNARQQGLQAGTSNLSSSAGSSEKDVSSLTTAAESVSTPSSVETVSSKTDQQTVIDKQPTINQSSASKIKELPADASDSSTITSTTSSATTNSSTTNSSETATQQTNSALFTKAESKSPAVAENAEQNKITTNEKQANISSEESKPANTTVAANTDKIASATKAEKSYSEPYRNQFHFSPSKNWMNDPNGLFYDDQTGLYHLYYQYNPEGNEWGNMSWGHATSKDMINWRQEPLAIPMLADQGWEDFVYTNTTGSLAKYGEVRYVGIPTTNWGDANGKKAIFSGSIYVDKNNVSGLGQNAILAFYTADYQIATRINDGKENGWGTWIGLNEIQEQHLAYSLDGGKTFKQYSADKNSAEPQPLIPVIASKGGDAANFRDPNVVYDQQNKQFLLTVVSNQQALIYKSVDLLHWEYASSIQREKNVGLGVWECPALIPLTVEGTKTTKWVLAISIQQGSHATGSGMEYYVGNIDHNGQWTPESTQTMANPMTMDYGEDFYAGIPFANMSNNRNVMLAWQSNWSYTGDAKTSPWYGNMTLPRELKLVKSSNTTDGYLLKNTVISEITHNEQADRIAPDDSSITPRDTEQKIEYSGNQYKLTADFSWDTKNPPTSVGFKLRASDDGKYYVLVGYDLTTKKFFVQRLNTGEAAMEAPRDKMNAIVDTANGTIKLTVYVDETSVEAFANDGEKSITQNFFMRPEKAEKQATNQLYLYVQAGTAHITGLKLNPLTSIWENKAKVTFNYIDDRGNQLLPSQQCTGMIGDKYQTPTVPKIKGYFLVKNNTQNKNQANLYTARDQIVDYLYQKNQTEIITKDTTIMTAADAQWSPAANFVSGKDMRGYGLTINDIRVTGAVDLSRAGIYHVSYTYTDEQGKTVSQVAQVKVIEPAIAAIEQQDHATLSVNEQQSKDSYINTLKLSKTVKHSKSKQFVKLAVLNQQDSSATNYYPQAVRTAVKKNMVDVKDKPKAVHPVKAVGFQKRLPQTGNIESSSLSIWGMLFAGLSGIGMLFGLKKKNF
ncbi:GH32 C-terminal domain-containing protein [Liquorilactobacillus capillatus]|uniref:Fructan hydrolase n=1 Tax=Liquorilactobacillus capillatus DSM 19910 TaxID=1423731 RepID=A0A0R1M158_9LACO|nr:GH32 C-terminal domain-containing protein [Liquorilactobacillus capillatus]KRL01727.1 fructan hydrolase [Liquorilactobacillus capillatus DSM 19910]